MNFSLLTQIGLIGITVFIAITYIKPMLGEISSLQDQVFEYEEAVEQAVTLNSELNSLTGQANSIGPTNMRALTTYLPDEIDSIAVLKDLEIIVLESGLFLNSVGTGEGNRSNNRGNQGGDGDEDRVYEAQKFTISAVGDYPQFKNLLRLLASNEYPLYVTNAEVGGGGEGTSILEFSVTVETYALISDSAEESEDANQ